VAEREITYLGQVGAVDHLLDLAARLGFNAGFRSTVRYEPAPGSVGHKSAFPVYEQALERAQEALEGAVFARSRAPWAISRALRVAANTRRLLAAKGHPVPGRRQWLKEVA
jgi:hypothetical protein